jgi:hypothetical protein
VLALDVDGGVRGHVDGRLGGSTSVDDDPALEDELASVSTRAREPSLDQLDVQSGDLSSRGR